MKNFFNDYDESEQEKDNSSQDFFTTSQEKEELTDFVILDDEKPFSSLFSEKTPENKSDFLFDPYTGKRLDTQPAQYKPPAQSWDFSDYDNQNPSNSTNQPEPIKQKKKINNGVKVFIGLVVFAFIFSAGILMSFSNDWFGIKSETEQENVKSDLYLNDRPADQEKELENGKLSIPAIEKKVKPSIVGIVAYHKGQSFQATSQGSGIILSSDGYIVTNAHVLFGSAQTIADGVNVVLDNNDQHEGKIVGYDTKTDLAVIKIEAKNLVPASFGNSDKSVVGELVVAVGNPSGLELAGSVTAGIISAVDRVIQYNESRSMKVIQTDAAVNPGNSGGALVNEYGQVIGINSAGKSKTEYEGINFAIPTTEAKPIIDSLIENGYIKGRVRMGIAFTSIDEVLARVENIPTGLKIVSIDKDMDVYTKGVRVGDIITKLDGKSVVTLDDIDKVMKNKKPGDSVKVSVFRYSLNGRHSTFDVDVKLVEDKTQVVD